MGHRHFHSMKKSIEKLVIRFFTVGHFTPLSLVAASAPGQQYIAVRVSIVGTRRYRSDVRQLCSIAH